MATSKVTAKSTKPEIFSAYQTLLQRIGDKERAQGGPDARLVVENEERLGAVQRAKSGTVEQLVEGLAKFRLSTADVISDLEKQLLEKRRQLEDVTSAIETESASLSQQPTPKGAGL